MNIISYIKNAVALFNDAISTKSKSVVDTYITALRTALPNIVVYGDIFPDTKVNVVIVVIDQDTIPVDIQKLLQPNDGIVTIVIVGELAKKLSNVTLVKEFVLDYCLDKIGELATEIFTNISGKMTSLSTNSKTITAIAKFVKNMLTVSDIESLLKTYIRSKVLAQTFALDSTTDLGAKVLKLRTILSQSEFDTGVELLMNLYGTKINGYIEDKFKTMTGQVTVY
jgi:hypothetical protein